MNNQTLNNFLNTMKEGFNENLPSILTAGSVVTMVATVAYSVYSGWRIKEIASSEELETKEKVKKIAVLSVPIAIGAVVSGGCAIGANRENKERYAALTALIATGASAVNKDELTDKVTELTGKKPKKVKEPVRDVNENEMITITDQVSGYKFTTTLLAFFSVVRNFDDMISTNLETQPLSSFYIDLLGDRYVTADIHDDIRFGLTDDGKTVLFNPELDIQLDADMKPEYVITYKYLR